MRVWLGAVVACTAFLPSAPAVAENPLLLVEPDSPVYRSRLVAGDRDVKIHQGNQLVGHVYAGGNLDLDGTIEGDAEAVGRVQGNGTVTGTSQDGVARLALPALPDLDTLRGLADRVLVGDQRWGDVTIDDILFVDGKIDIEGSLDGKGTLIAARDLKLSKGPASLDDETYLSIIALGKLDIDKDRRLRAVIRAARDVKIDKNADFAGVIVADGKIDLHKDGRYRFLPPDSEGPAIEFLAPADGAILAAAAPTIEATFLDAGSALDPASVLFTVDGVDRTAEATITIDGSTIDGSTIDGSSGSLRFEPVSPLADGPHTIELRVADQAGNGSLASLGFAVDTTLPSLVFTAPAAGPQPVNLANPEVRLTLVDPDSDGAPGSGIAASSFRLRDTGPAGGVQDLGLACTIGVGEVVCRPPRLAAGVHVLGAEVRDLAGNLATAERAIEILLDETPPRIEILAPAAGPLVNPGSIVAELRFADGDSGVDFGSLKVRLDGGSPLGGCAAIDEAGLPVGATCPLPTLGEGAHRLEATIADRAGRAAQAAVDFSVELDTVPPTLAFDSPDAGTLARADGRVAVRVDFADRDLGIDPPSFGLALDGASVLGECDFQLADDLRTGRAACELDLESGNHRLEASVADRAGNAVTARRDFDLAIDLAAPVITIVEPVAELAEGIEAPPIALTFAETGLGLDLSSLSIRLGGRELVSGCTFDPSGAACDPGPLADGTYSLVVRLADRAGNEARATRQFRVRTADRAPPVLTVVEPIAGRVVGATRARIVAEDPSGLDPSSLLVLLDEGQVGDSCTLTGAGTSIEIECPLAGLGAGPHDLAVQIRDGAGNRGSATVAFDLELQLPVSITTPETGFLTREGSVRVAGSVGGLGGDSAGATVRLGESSAEVEADGSFALDIDLKEGANTLTVVARSADGAVGTHTITVVRDTEAPRPVIRTPADGLVTTSPSVVVAGDLLMPSSSGTRQEKPEVRVLGLPATVEQRAFFRDAVMLVPGENLLVAEATDAAGNVARDEIRVTYLAQANTKIEELQGNGQRAQVGARLEQPLVVRAVDAFGAPLAGRLVEFEVSRGDGRLLAYPDEDRIVRVRTDALGLAQVGFRLGRRSGDGLHEVTARSEGLAGSVVFCASAEPTAPERVVRVVGDIHLGALTAAADAEAPFPLTVQVFDRYGNPLPGVAVDFATVEGSGHFDGQPSATSVTDDEGRAAVRFTLGPEVGVDAHRVEATFDGLTGAPARFALTGVLPGPEAETRVAGLVLDNEDEAVPGATVRIRGTSLETTTLADGRFELAGVPVGTIDLEVDGTTTTEPGRWPVLHFVFDTISGHRNDLGMPVRLLPLETGPIVGGEEDVTIPIPGVAGGELTVFANSVHFPDGSRTGEVSITQVHGDKVPMLPPLGSGFMLAWTVQPPGAHFDPPARISIPNMGGEVPGTVVDIFSFDHDLGEFVPIGTATVNEDGTRVVSDRGSGVVEAGWHGCVPPPLPPTDVCSPDEQKCQVCEDEKLVSRCDEDCQVCDEGTCREAEIEELSFLVEGSDGEDTNNTVVVALDQEVDFVPLIEHECRQRSFSWDFGDGQTSEEDEPTHTYEEAGEYEVVLTAQCEPCPGSVEERTLKIQVLEVDLEVQELPEEDAGGEGSAPSSMRASRATAGPGIGRVIAKEGEEEPNEEMPGGFLFVNDDDDNGNDTDDLDEPNQVENEDDLVEAKIILPEELDQGTVRLEALRGGAKILVWEDDAKSGLVELPATWNFGAGGEGGEGGEGAPEAVWLEATESSQELRDIELLLTFEAETLEEPLEDKVILTAIDLELEVSPSETEQRWLDDSVSPVGIGASVFFRDLADPEKLVAAADDTVLAWTATAGGASIESESMVEDGFAPALATMPESPGGPYRFEARLKKLILPEDLESLEIETEQRRETTDIRVVPSEAVQLDLESSPNSVPADGTSQVQLTASVLDRHGHPVEDGTPIAWEIIDGQGELRSFESEVVGGVASATLVPAASRDPEVVVEIVAGAERTETTVSLVPITARLSASRLQLDSSLAESALVTVETNAGDGTPVAWSAVNGLTENSQTQVSGGQASILVSSATASPGEINVAVRIGDTFATWQGEVFTSATTSLSASAKALISDRTSTGVLPVRLSSGKMLPVPQMAETTMTVRGPEDGFGRAAFQGARLAEALRFDSEVDGIVPGEVGGASLELGDAVLDTTLAYRGGASARALGLDPMRMAGPTFGNEMLLSLWVRPEVLGASTLASQGEAWSLETLDDGRVRARIPGAEVISPVPLVEDEWNLVSLLVEPGELRLNVEESTVATATLAPSLASTEPIELAEGFVGHVDEISFYDTVGQLSYVVPRGLDALGIVALDEAGTGIFQLASRGRSLAYFQLERVLVQVTTSADGAALLAVDGVLDEDARRALEKDGSFEFATDVVTILAEETGRDLLDFVDSFFGGDPDSVAGWVGALVGGTLGIADLGALAREVLKFAGLIEGEVEPLVVALSILGLVTTPIPGGDQGITILRILATKAAGTRLIRYLKTLLDEVIAAGRGFSDDLIDFLQSLRRRVEGCTNLRTPAGPIDSFLVDLDAEPQATEKAGCSEWLRNQMTANNLDWLQLLYKDLGDDIYDLTETVIQQTPDGLRTARYMLRYLKETPEAVPLLKKAQDAGQLADMYSKMATMISRRAVGPGILMKVIGNCKHICSDDYPVWKLIDDMSEVSKNLEGKALEAFKSHTKRLRQGFNTTPPNQTAQVLGNRYELEVARKCQKDGGVVRFVAFFVETAAGNTDVDVLCIKGDVAQVIQAKRGKSAFGSPEKVEEWVTKADAFGEELVGTNASLEIDIRYAVPDATNVPPSVQTRLKELLGPEFEADTVPSARGGGELP